ncbi:MAG: hypothetical protein HFI78_09215 [Lachnospiraceae bacterium]|jgi:replication initiation and membrane attachment protein DnaB|nr:hypothetical protein [Lachnospiraceae bacterium]
MAKRNISYRIDDQSYNKLSTLANTYQVSVNEMARILLIDTLNNNSIDDGTVRELRDDITKASKELTILQHYIERVNGNKTIKEAMKGSVSTLWLTLNQHTNRMEMLRMQ